MEKIDKCPVCNCQVFEEFLQCKDHFLTGEIFIIVKCNQCGLFITNPRPDVSQLNKYYKSENYISHSNTRKGVMNLIYHIVRKYNHRMKYKLITKYINQGEILDIGCGTGEFLKYFANKGWRVTGLEPNTDARNFAINNNKIVVLPEKDISQLSAKRFNVITLWHVLEHVPNLLERMNEIKTLLKDDGLLVIAIPNAACFDARHYKTFWAGYDVPRHLWHFEQKVALQFFGFQKLSCIKISPLKFDAYYISLLSEKYLTGSSNFFKAIKNGNKSNRIAKKFQNNYSSLIFILKKEKT